MYRKCLFPDHGNPLFSTHFVNFYVNCVTFCIVPIECKLTGAQFLLSLMILDTLLSGDCSTKLLSNHLSNSSVARLVTVTSLSADL